MDKPAVDAMLKEAPKQAFETDPQDDPRKPIPVNLKPESLPDADEVRDRVLEMFPDMGKLKTVSENTVSKRIDGAVSFLLGVLRPVQAIRRKWPRVMVRLRRRR